MESRPDVGSLRGEVDLARRFEAGDLHVPFGPDVQPHRTAGPVAPLVDLRPHWEGFARERCDGRVHARLMSYSEFRANYCCDENWHREYMYE